MLRMRKRLYRRCRMPITIVKSFSIATISAEKQ
nr:MAG TPA: hypothetical protein [Caudoviricetes sp.]